MTSSPVRTTPVTAPSSSVSSALRQAITRSSPAPVTMRDWKRALGRLVARDEAVERVARVAALAGRDGRVEPVGAEQLGLVAAEHRARRRVDRAHAPVGRDDDDHRSGRQQVDDGTFQPVHGRGIGSAAQGP